MFGPFTKEEQAEWLKYDKSFEGERLVEDEPNAASQGWGHHGAYELVGNGAVTNPENAEGTNPKACGRFYGYDGCVHTEFHDVVTLDGVSHKGNAYVKKKFRWCNSPHCPICMKHGWAVREAGEIQDRIKVASQRFGKAEHIIASVPISDYGLDFYQLKAKALNALTSRGVIGGVLIFHAFRYADHEESKRKGVPFGWYWSPHFHCIGFLEGGYARCRGCTKSTYDCLSCGGFEGVTRRQYKKDGFIVKVKAERKTIFGTAWYQLNHASVLSNKGRVNVAVWFGVCGKRKMKLYKEDRTERDKCPICGMELVQLRYLGFESARIAGEFWITEWEEPAFDKDGLPVWVEKT